MNIKKREWKKEFIVGFFVFIAIVLLAIRLLFFLKDGTSDYIESILIRSIAIISLGIVGLILLYQTSLKEKLRKHGYLILMIGMFCIYECLFYGSHAIKPKWITLFSFIAISAILVGLFNLLTIKMQKLLVVTFLIIMPIYFLAQDIYFSIFDRYFSFIEVVTLREGVESAEGVIQLKAIHGIYGLLLVFSLIVFRLMKKWVNQKHQPLMKNHLKKGFIYVFICVLLMQLNATYPPKTARLHLSDHYLYVKLYDNNRFVNQFGLTNYFFRDLVKSVTPNRPNKKDIQAINEFLENEANHHENNEWSGLFEGKNLVFLVAESFDYLAISEELTPNIMKLQKEGIHFTNHYVPVYPRTTCDTEFIYNTGLIPSIMDGPTCYMFNQNTYSQSLANLFNEKGYMTRAFHSNYKEFYTRDLVYDGFGYDALYGQHEIGLSNTEKRYDSIFFDKAKDEILPEDGPFMSFVLTLSGHSPYKPTNLAIEKHIDTVKNTFPDYSEDIQMYIAAQLEMDLVVGQLFDALEEKGLIEDTVIIFTTDHYPYTLNKEAYERHTGITEDYQKMHSPLFIWSENIEGMSYNGLSSSFDLLPTIANLFSLDANYAYYPGQDLFQEDVKPLVLYKDFSWYDGVHYVKDGEVIDGTANPSLIEAISNKVDQLYDIGHKILRNNYFKME